MEKPSRSIPAKLSPKSTALITLIIAALSLLTTSSSATASKDREVDAAITSLRSAGYTLFANAIATSDLRYLLTSSATSFTLFSPHDSSLFSLDMSSSASDYVTTLRYHVAPRRFSFSALRNLSCGSHLETLFPHHLLLIDKSQVMLNGVVLNGVTVDGVRILVPDLYLGSGISVHGLDGILDCGFLSEGDSSDGERFQSPSVSPSVSSPEYISPHLPQFQEPDLVTPVKPPVYNEPAEMTFKKDGKHHGKHSRRKSKRRRVDGHQQHDDNGHNDDGRLKCGFLSDWDFSDDPSLAWPSIWPTDCSSPHLKPPMHNEPPEKTRKSSLKKDGKHHQKHSRRKSKLWRAHDHQKPDDKDHNDIEL